MFLNNFSNNCEEKFAKVSSRITGLETTLMIFEAKLNSLPLNSDNQMTSSRTPITSTTTTTTTATRTKTMDAKDVFNDNSDQISYQYDNISKNKEFVTQTNVQKDAVTYDSTSDYSGNIQNERTFMIVGNQSQPPPPPPPLPLTTPSAPPAFMRGVEDVNSSTSEIAMDSDGERSRMKVRDHPDYVSYFKMMKVPTLH